MGANFDPPQKLSDLFGDIGEIARAFALLNALQNLKVVVRLPSGALATCPVVITGGEAVINIAAGSVLPDAAAPQPPNTINNAKNAAPMPSVAGDGL